MVISLPISKNYVWPVLVVFEIKATWEFHRVSYNIALALDRAVIMTMKSSSGHIFWILLRCVICWHLKVPIVTFISAHWQTFHCMFSGHVNLPVLDEKLSHHYVNPRTLFNPTLQRMQHYMFSPDFRLFVFIFSPCKSITPHSQNVFMLFSQSVLVIMPGTPEPSSIPTPVRPQHIIRLLHTCLIRHFYITCFHLISDFLFSFSLHAKVWDSIQAYIPVLIYIKDRGRLLSMPGSKIKLSG